LIEHFPVRALKSQEKRAMSNLDNLNRLGSLGNLHIYTKNLTMTNRWKQRKESGDLVVRYDENAYRTEAGKAMARRKQSDYQLLSEFQEQQENTDTRLSEIRNKLVYGTALSDDEIEYLRDKDPQTYAMIKAEESRNKAFAKKLARARTKDEAQQIMTNRENEAVMKIKSVENNPNISDADKLTVYADARRSVLQGREIFRKFVASGAYDRLPTEAEKLEAEKEIKEAQEAERCETADADSTVDKPGEQKQEQDQNQIQNQDQDQNRIQNQDQDQNRIQNQDQNQGKTSEDETEKSAFPSSDAKTVSEAENTEKALKVRRARVKPDSTRFLHTASADSPAISVRTAGTPAPSGAGGSIDLRA
jgi:hypothetical protein